MTETPAAALLAKEIAPYVDFTSFWDQRFNSIFIFGRERERSSRRLFSRLFRCDISFDFTCSERSALYELIYLRGISCGSSGQTLRTRHTQITISLV